MDIWQSTRFWVFLFEFNNQIKTLTSQGIVNAESSSLASSPTLLPRHSRSLNHKGSFSKSFPPYSDCFCDVTTSCDDSCCCDPNCSASAISYWNNYYLCANDGFAIPFCSAYYSQPLHVHDLSQGLRLIYTVRLGLFFRWSKDCFASRRLTSSIPARAIRLRPRISSCLRVRVR